MIISNLENQGGIGSTTEYMNGVVFEDGVIQYYTNETGRVLKVTGGYETQYVINDHLGNARMTLKADVNNEPVVLQYNSYYPFGLEMGGMSFVSGTTENKYKYNGKELQTAHNLGWYDYGARFYDPQLGRWHVVDPLAEKYVDFSSYSYCINNPILFVDPDGREIRISFTAHINNKSIVQTVIYQKEGLVNLDGTSYKGDNAYIKTVEKQLNQLKNDDSEINTMVNDLQKSENTHTISNVDKNGEVGDNRNQPVFKMTTDGNIDERSSHTRFNPWDSRDPSIKGGTRNPRVALVHELTHASDRDNDNITNATTKEGIPVNEMNAIKNEQKVRQKTGDQPRKKFGGIEIP